MTDTASGRRRASSAPPQVRRFSAGVIASAVLAGPAFGVTLGAVDGGSRLVFMACCCVAAVFASLFSSPAGLWWVATGVPPFVVACAIVSELLWHPGHAAYAGTKQEVVGLARGVLAGFPVMALAGGLVLVIAAVRFVQARKGRRSARV